MAATEDDNGENRTDTINPDNSNQQPLASNGELKGKQGYSNYNNEKLMTGKKKTDTKGLNVEGVSPYLQTLLGAIDIPGDFDVPLNTKPDWLDLEKFRRGQKFAMEHLVCIEFSETLSLMLVFSVDRGLQPLIFTGRSDTPYKAFERYLSTTARIMSWYQDDLWGETAESNLGRRNIMAVNRMHRNVQSRMASMSEEELRKKVTVGDETKTPVWSTPIRKMAQKDCQSACPGFSPSTCPAFNNSKFLTQLDMAVTQFTFVGLFVTYPERFGAHDASDEDLDAFVHVWRGLGYLLGIREEHNFCNADLETVRQRSREIIDFMFKPALKDVSSDWEHMTRCLLQGISFYMPINYEASLWYLCDVLGIETPLMYKSLSYWQWFNYKFLRFMLDKFMLLPGAVGMYNSLFLHIRRTTKELPPKTLAKWEQMEFPYMKRVKES